MRRRFNASERIALYLAAGGRCQGCGAPLRPHWHGDHVVPFWFSQETDVSNGQALCPPCNLRKGGHMTTPDNRYRWQDDFIADYHVRREPQDYTLAACPGSGKTRAALRLAREMLDTRQVSRVIIVAPTRAVKRQWGLAANNEGINLDWRWENGLIEIPADMDGIVITFQSVSRESVLYRALCGQRPTLVILDEIHHATEGADWGDSVVRAFEGAKKRLMLSGTPYHATRRIAFLKYDEEGFVVPDMHYGYRDAVTARTCRSIFFPKYGGKTEWSRNDIKDEATFGTPVSQAKAADRLRTAVSADTESIHPIAEQMIRDANAQLSEVRDTGNGNAGGLIIARGRTPGERARHADCIAAHVERITGRRPPVVVSDDKLSLTRIDAFRESTERWLVAVQMVSEGVDIPRLQVLVYLTTITSPLHFDQAAGRISRGEGSAWFYIPNDDSLVRNALRIADMRKQALKEMSEAAQELVGSWDELMEPEPNSFIPLGGTADEAGVVFAEAEDALFGVHRIDGREYVAARTELAASWPGFVPHDVVARYALAKQRATQPPGCIQPANPMDGSLLEQKQALRDAQNRMVRQHCIETGKDYAIVNNQLNQAVNITKLKLATLDELRQRMRLVEELCGVVRP